MQLQSAVKKGFGITSREKWGGITLQAGVKTVSGGIPWVEGAADTRCRVAVCASQRLFCLSRIVGVRLPLGDVEVDEVVGCGSGCG